jgi:hypothetical protein
MSNWQKLKLLLALWSVVLLFGWFWCNFEIRIVRRIDSFEQAQAEAEQRLELAEQQRESERARARRRAPRRILVPGPMGATPPILHG